MGDAWIDKNQLKIMLVLTIIIYAFSVSGIYAVFGGDFGNPVNSIIGLVIIVLLCLWPVISFHYWPVRISGNFIVLARYGGMRIGRKAIPLDEIREIKITGTKKWDEGGRIDIYRVVRVIDIRGGRYRNMIYKDSVAEFKSELARRGLYNIAEIKKEQKPEEDTCLACGEKIPGRETTCPECGWSWKE